MVLMTDDQRLPDPREAIKQLPRDSMVIFRHYGHPDRARLAAKIRIECRRLGHRILMANDIELALALGADGVHLPEYRIWQSPSIYQQIPENLIVTSACHGMATLRKICLLPRRFRPDGLLISPVFATRSHPGATSLSSAQVRHMAMQCHQRGITPIGLGGINRETCGFLRSSSLASLAGIGFSSEQTAPFR